MTNASHARSMTPGSPALSLPGLLLRSLIAAAGRPFESAATATPMALLLAAPACLATSEARAQAGGPLPTPVPARDFEAMLGDAGLPESVRDAALPVHETYFARFREFESREIDPALDRAASEPFDLNRTVEDARRIAERRRRFFSRAAQLDNQLVDEVAGLLVAEEALRLESVRSALARRRAANAVPNSGFASRVETFDLRRTATVQALGAASRAAVAPTLDAYDAELTRLLERYADAATGRLVRAAELREERGIGMNGAASADGGAPDQEALDAWFRQMQEVQQEAGKDMSAARQRIRRLHRDVLAQLEAALEPRELRTLRSELASGVYPMLLRKDAFAPAVAEAESRRAKGALDEAQWSAASAIIESHAIAARPLVEAMMDLADKSPENEGFIPFGGEESELEARVKELRQDLESLQERDAEALLAAIGAGTDGASARGRDARGQDVIGGVGVIGQDGGGMIGSSVQIAVMGGDGEAIVLSGDDLGDSGLIFAGGGGGGGVARPMDAEEIDVLARRLGFGEADRAIFDEIVGRCVEARNAAEAENPPAPGGMVIGGEGGITLSLSIGGDGEVMADAPGGDPEKLAAAIETAEERMFDELRAAVAAERAEVAEAARRARARTRLLAGERGAAAADLVAIAEKATIAETARSAIADDVRAWDEGSVAALRAMREELREVARRREELMASATREAVDAPDVDLGEAGAGAARIGVAQAITMTEEIAKELGSLERRGAAARAKVADANRRTLDALAERLAGDPTSQKALRRAYLRAVNPSIYRIPRDLSGAFGKALAIESLGERGRAEVELLRDEWIESRESLCETFLLALEEEARESEAKARGADGADVAAGFRSMEERARVRKRLRADLEQLEATIFRRLEETLLVEVGPEKAKSIGALPASRRPGMIEFGN